MGLSGGRVVLRYYLQFSWFVLYVKVGPGMSIHDIHWIMQYYNRADVLVEHDVFAAYRTVLVLYGDLGDYEVEGREVSRFIPYLASVGRLNVWALDESSQVYLAWSR